MTAITREQHNQFRIRFGELERGGVRGLFRPEAARGVDPFLIARAVVEVMRQGALRSAAGRLLLWNQYRVILAAADLEPLRALERRLERDLEAAAADEARRLGAELVGPLRVGVVADEAGELAPGEAVVRVEFAPADPAAAVADSQATVFGERAPLRRCLLSWPGGAAALAPGPATAVGRAHAAPPERFVALPDASTRISKLHLWIQVGPASVTVGRFPAANPVEIAGALVAAGAQVELAADRLPVDISLSRGEMALALAWE